MSLSNMAGAKTTLMFVTLLLLVVLLEGYPFPRRHYPGGQGCLWITWSKWSDCNHQCGKNGVRTRQRIAIRGGCYDSEIRDCNRFCYNGGTPMNGFCSCKDHFSGSCCSLCTIKDCELGEWSSWSECTPDCGATRYNTRNRSVLQETECGGLVCNGTLTETNGCTPNCLNGGMAVANKCQCVTPFSGDCCGICNPINCSWGEWNQWTSCEPVCGGNRQRKRTREPSPEMCGGSRCLGIDTEIDDCDSICYNGNVSSEGLCTCQEGYTGLCCDSCEPLDCIWGSWLSWTSCQPSCGNNRTRAHLRVMTLPPKCGGSCTGLPEETETCESDCQNGGSPMDGYCACIHPFSGICCEICTPVDCEWSLWESWSVCHPVCGAVRNRSRTKSILEHSQCRGTKCGSQPTETSLCLPECFHEGTAVDGACNCTPSYTGICCDLCVAIDCVWDEWSSWSSCSPECGSKRSQTRTRQILSAEKCGGFECTGESSQHQPCPALCFNGGTPVNESCNCPPSFSGECCGSCKPSDCHWEEWQEWSTCQPRCGTNRQRKRIRSLLAHATCDGLCPGSNKDIISCNDTCEHGGTPMDGYCLCQRPYSGTCCETCIPTNCELTSWSEWSGCSPDCGVNRTRTRTRSLDHEAECGGLECNGNFIKEQELCTSLCHNGGVATYESCRCHLPFMGTCCEKCVPTDCLWTEWTTWTSCLPVCGNNRSQTKTRFVRKPRYCGGQCIGNNTMYRPCESVCYNGGEPISSDTCQCPKPFSGSCCETCKSANCTWGNWQAWSECQPKCGSTRKKSRIRILEKHSVCGGTCSGSPFENESCEALCFNGGTAVDGHCLCPFPFSPVSCCKTADGDPCIYHVLLNNPGRSIRNSEITNRSTCDISMNSDFWYRFSSVGGSRIIDKCVTIDKCGVNFPMWLKGKHPINPDHEVQRHVCVSESEDGVTKCCEHKKIVTIKKCTDFYIYKLHAARSCEEGYCVGEESPCPLGTHSPNGYSPNCFAPSPRISEPQLYLEDTSEGFHLVCVFVYSNHQNVSFTVIWSSEKDELYRDTLSKSRKSILPGEMIDDNHLLIYCKITAKYLYEDGTDKSMHSPAISSRSILLSQEELHILPKSNNKTIKPEVSTRTQEEECCSNYILPIGISAGIAVLLIVTIVTIIVIKKKRIRAPSSKLFILNSNAHGSCERLHSATDENNCNTAL